MGTVSSTIALVDQMSGALANIESNINSMKSALKGVEDAGESLNGANFSKFLASAEAAGEKMIKIGAKMSAAISAPLLWLGKQLYGNAVEYEAAYTGMTKTVEGTAEQYEHLNEVVLQLSETTPTAYTELMGIAQSGGNLGVSIDNMEAFLSSYSALQAATDKHISGESGAQLVADFLNITDGGVQNIERFSSSIVDLGNHFNATEDQILGMGKRMAAAATLAGLSTPEILGMAAAFRSVGINEEAGGSAASKFIKQMQLASEVGGQAQDILRNTEIILGKTDTGEKILFNMDEMGIQKGLDFVNYIQGLKNAEKVNMADQLGITTEALQSMADSWLLMDQFAEVSGKTSEQFVKDWGQSPVQAMSDFFTGLSQLGDKGGESILATLDKMGLTEIRESNLIAAMASHPELFASAVQTAVEAYTQNNALWEEFNKQTSTQQAQNEMLGNKLQNTMADLGQNLVEALQPALDMVNNLLTAFNNLSETDQTNIIKGLMIIAALGPALGVAGGAIKAIAAAMQLISGSGKGAADAVKSVIDAAGGSEAASAAEAATTAAGTGSALAGAGGLALIAAGFIWAINERRTNEDIRGGVKAIANATNGVQELQNAFVDYVNANAALNNLIESGNWTDDQANALLDDLNAKQQLFTSLEGWEKVMQAYSDWRQENSYGNEDWLLPENLFDYFQTPETPQVDIPEIEIPEPEVTIPEFDLPEVELPDVQLPEITIAGTDIPVINLDIPDVNVETGTDMGLVVGEGFGIGFTQGIETSGSEAVTAASSMTKGAVSSAKDALSAADTFSFGNDFAAELGSGIDSGSGAAVASISALAAAVLGAVQGILNAGAGSGIGLAFGSAIGIGISSSNGLVSAASRSVSNAAFSTAKGILSSGAGSAIGRAFGAGLAAGIRASTGAVVAAASAMASAAKAAAASVLSIHSPSKVMYWQGEMTALGFANGIKDSQSSIIKSVESVMDNTKSVWNEGVWDLIGSFAEVEAKAWQDEMNDVEDKVTISDSDIKKIRDLAEREVINHFTSPSFNIEMPTTVYAEKETDIDGIIDRLENKVAERLADVAEGVYT